MRAFVGSCVLRSYNHWHAVIVAVNGFPSSAETVNNLLTQRIRRATNGADFCTKARTGLAPTSVLVTGSSAHKSRLLRPATR
jgi:hypothetical protein